MTDISSILATIADRGGITRDELCTRLSLSDDYLNNLLHRAQQLGVAIAETEQGLCWCRPVPLLDPTLIHSRLDERTKALLEGLDLFFELESTNSHLLQQPELRGKSRVCVAETQTLGRGRRGKQWISPPCSNVYLSIGQRLSVPAEALSGLSLGVGLVIAELLKPDLVGSLGLKWPNDLYVDGQKLGGVLVELKGANDRLIDVVVGVGLNVLSHPSTQKIDQPWTALESCVHSGVSLDRNLWVIRLLNKLVPFLATFPHSGTEYIQERWSQFDLCFGQDVSVHAAQQQFSGLGAGIDSEFNFLLKQGDTVHSFTAAEVGLRLR